MWWENRLKEYIDNNILGTSKKEKLEAAKKQIEEWLVEEKAREESEKEQKKLEEKIREIYTTFYADWLSNPYKDKVETPTRNGKTIFNYEYENGHTIDFEGDKLIFTDDKRIIQYTIGHFWSRLFTEFINGSIINKGRNRNNGSSYSFSFSSQNSDKDKNCNHPKWEIYQTLIVTIRSRTEQLSKMSKTSSDRPSLENELNATKRRMEAIKDKYGF